VSYSALYNPGVHSSVTPGAGSQAGGGGLWHSLPSLFRRPAPAWLATAGAATDGSAADGLHSPIPRPCTTISSGTGCGQPGLTENAWD
jgi:hypothetical protein